MTQPPLVDVAVPVAIHTARKQDLLHLVTLEELSFAEPWRAGALAAELRHPASLVLVARPRDLGACAYAAFRLAAGDGELLRLAVAPPWRRQGIARTLVARGLRRLRDLGVRACYLEVRPDNRAALELYSEAGFRQVGRRPAYYRDGSGALIYIRELRTTADNR
jgi:ribosomal-protein-alanine N-acetyltransferase